MSANGFMPFQLIRQITEKTEVALGDVATENDTVNYPALEQAQALANSVITTIGIYNQIFLLDDGSQITDLMKQQLVAAMPADIREFWIERWSL